jgi:hypothetical protein
MNTPRIFGGDRPTGHTETKVIARETYDIGRGAIREALLLECGHCIERKPRPARLRGIICPECPGQ